MAMHIHWRPLTLEVRQASNLYISELEKLVYSEEREQRVGMNRLPDLMFEGNETVKKSMTWSQPSNGSLALEPYLFGGINSNWSTGLMNV